MPPEFPPNPLDNTSSTPPQPTTPSTTEEPPAPEQQPPAPEPAVTVSREAIKLPDGVEIDAPLLDEFVATMNNAELNPITRAQALVDLQAKVMQQASERVSREFTDQQNEWQKQIREDPQLGGEKLDPALGQIAQLINTYPQSAELRQVLDVTGAGNNPHLIKFLHQVASRLAEATPAPAGTPPTAPANTEQARAEKLFPTMRS